MADIERELREMMHDQAGQLGHTPLATRALVRRARLRRSITVAGTGALVLAVLAVGLAVGQAVRDTRADEPIDWPKPHFTSTAVPWCVPDPDDPQGRQLIVGAGPPIRTWCTWTGEPGGGRWLWHHAGSTILTREISGTTRTASVFRVADGQLTRLGTSVSTSAVVKMSHDGRYVAWTDGCQLNVYEVATAIELAATSLPAEPGMKCDVDGIDDLGRVYVTVSDEDSWEFKEVQMYDLRTGEWTRVVGIPASTPPMWNPFIRYVTADGFAAYQDEYVSVEGAVDDDGRFVPQREVPVGRGLWSPDRSLFVEQRDGDVVVRPDTDLTSGQVLDLPIESYAPEGPALYVQWESPSSVLVSSNEAYGEHVVGYRCDIRSGTCQTLSRDGYVAIGNSWGHELGG